MNETNSLWKFIPILLILVIVLFDLSALIQSNLQLLFPCEHTQLEENRDTADIIFSLETISADYPYKNMRSVAIFKMNSELLSSTGFFEMEKRYALCRFFSLFYFLSFSSLLIFSDRAFYLHTIADHYPVLSLKLVALLHLWDGKKRFENNLAFDNRYNLGGIT